MIAAIEDGSGVRALVEPLFGPRGRQVLAFAEGAALAVLAVLAVLADGTVPIDDPITGRLVATRFPTGQLLDRAGAAHGSRATGG